MPSGFLRTGLDGARRRDDDGEEAGEALGVLEGAALEDPLQPAHLERGVRRAHHAGHLDGDGLAADLGERVVVAGVLVERHRRPVGDEVVGLEPVLAHHHGIDRQRAHVVDEARQVEGDLRVARLVGLGRGSDRARPAPSGRPRRCRAWPSLIGRSRAGSPPGSATAPGSRAPSAASCAPARARCRCARPRPGPPSGRASPARASRRSARSSA